MHLIFIYGTRAGEATPLDGKFLKAYDPPEMFSDGEFGPGTLEGTDNLDEALKFPDAGAAYECYKKQNGTRPYDGKPNRPLTAWNVEISTEEVFRAKTGR